MVSRCCCPTHIKKVSQTTWSIHSKQTQAITPYQNSKQTLVSSGFLHLIKSNQIQTSSTFFPNQPQHCQHPQITPTPPNPISLDVTVTFFSSPILTRTHTHKIPFIQTHTPFKRAHFTNPPGSLAGAQGLSSEVGAK